MATKIQLRRDTASNWTSENPTLSAGELGFETDTDKIKIGDGSTAWTSLGYLIDSTDDFDGTFGSLTGTPTTLSGYGITDAFDGAFSSLTGTPTTLSGYGITDAFDGAYSSLTGAPTNISSFTNDSGYITSYTVTQGDVTAHQAALSITESQISDLGTYLTTVALTELSDVSSSSATTGQVLTAQSDGSFAFADQTGSSSGGISFSDVAITASSGQTEFSDSTVTIQDGVTLVFLNGVRLVETTDFTVSESGNSITLTEAAEVGDIIQICTFYTPASEESAACTGIQGSYYGYTSAGGAAQYRSTIDRFPFAADTDASSVGSVTAARTSVTGQSSTEYGYTSGGYYIPSGTPYFRNIIDKFPFATSTANATDAGDLTVARSAPAGQSSIDNGYGYTSGGRNPAASNIIDKFTFASDANATDVGDLISARSGAAGQSSCDYGYTSGGGVNIIDKFSFSSDGNATDVGDITVARYAVAGQSSTSYGYTSGGSDPSVPNLSDTNVIDKFPFATDANATDVGNLTVARRNVTGQSSTNHGYTSGGWTESGSSYKDIIDKFSFSTDGNATDVGNLIEARAVSAGQQY